MAQKNDKTDTYIKVVQASDMAGRLSAGVFGTKQTIVCVSDSDPNVVDSYYVIEGDNYNRYTAYDLPETNLQTISSGYVDACSSPITSAYQAAAFSKNIARELLSSKDHQFAPTRWHEDRNKLDEAGWNKWASDRLNDLDMARNEQKSNTTLADRTIGRFARGTNTQNREEQAAKSWEKLGGNVLTFAASVIIGGGAPRLFAQLGEWGAKLGGAIAIGAYALALASGVQAVRNGLFRADGPVGKTIGKLATTADDVAKQVDNTITTGARNVINDVVNATAPSTN